MSADTQRHTRASRRADRVPSSPSAGPSTQSPHQTFSLTCGTEVHASAHDCVPMEDIYVPVLPEGLHSGVRILPEEQRAPKERRRAQVRRTGCGARVHDKATRCPPTRAQSTLEPTPPNLVASKELWSVSAGGLAPTVLPLDLHYFPADAVNELNLDRGSSTCGCEVHGVGCMMCGNALGALRTFCHVHAPRAAPNGFVIWSGSVTATANAREARPHIPREAAGEAVDARLPSADGREFRLPPDRDTRLPLDRGSSTLQALFRPPQTPSSPPRRGFLRAPLRAMAVSATDSLPASASVEVLGRPRQPVRRHTLRTQSSFEAHFSSGEPSAPAVAPAAPRASSRRDLVFGTASHSPDVDAMSVEARPSPATGASPQAMPPLSGGLSEEGEDRGIDTEDGLWMDSPRSTQPRMLLDPYGDSSFERILRAARSRNPSGAGSTILMADIDPVAEEGSTAGLHRVGPWTSITIDDPMLPAPEPGS